MGFSILAAREMKQEPKKWKWGERERKEENACRQAPRFWKPAFASERGVWFFPTPSPLFYLRHFLRNLWLSFLVLCSQTARKRLLRRLDLTTRSSIALENSRHLATLPLIFPPNDVWETSVEIPYWWRVTTQIWVVLLIGRVAWEIYFNKSEALPRSGWWRVISMEFLRSFLKRHLAEKPVVASPKVCCFLRLDGVGVQNHWRRTQPATSSPGLYISDLAIYL